MGLRAYHRGTDSAATSPLIGKPLAGQPQMQTRTRLAAEVVAIVAAAIGLLTGIYHVSEYWEFMCGNDVVAEKFAPDGRKKVVVFQRDCGATTGFSTQASLLGATSRLPARGGNIFVADTCHGSAPAAAWGGPRLEVRWISNERVRLSYDASACLFRGETVLDGIKIEHDVSR
jgi:hypothetical protein